MLQKLQYFKEKFNQKKVSIGNIYLNEVLYQFKCYLESEITEIKDEEKETKYPTKESKIVVIDKIDELDDSYFVILFDKTILFINPTNINEISSIFKEETNMIIIPVCESVMKEDLPKDLQTSFNATLNDFDINNYLRTIQEFSSQFDTRNTECEEIMKFLIPSFSTYLINKSYEKLEESKIENFQIPEKILNKEKILFLQHLGVGCTSYARLIYHIELGQLFAIKTLYLKDEKGKQLYDREIKNYERIRHPSLPRFYGESIINNEKCMVIEYIRGQRLDKMIKETHFFEDKVNLIFQMMVIIEYLQNNKLIYRDMKPDNFIVDKYKRLFLIDFDRMIGEEEQEITEETTIDFGSNFHPPEIRDGTIKEYTFEEDVYSLGQLFEFIFSKQDSQMEQTIFQFEESFDLKSILNDIFKECKNEEPTTRPKITMLIDSFYENFIDKISIKETFLQNHLKRGNFQYWMLIYENDNPKYKRYLELFYKQENEFSYLIKYIHIYSEYFNINHLISQFRLGLKHYPQRYFVTNINTIIHYFEI